MVVVISYISNAIYYKEYFHTHTHDKEMSIMISLVVV